MHFVLFNCAWEGKGIFKKDKPALGVLIDFATSVGLSEPYRFTKVGPLDRLQGCLGKVSLAVTEVMLTMGRWLAEKGIAGCLLHYYQREAIWRVQIPLARKGEKILEQKLADHQKSEPLIVFINRKITSKCFFLF